MAEDLVTYDTPPLEAEGETNVIIEVSIWQLADDASTYVESAAHFILTTPDGEDEMSQPFPTEEAAKAYAARLGWKVVPLEVE